MFKSYEPGAYLLTVNATDSDTGINGIITYRLDEQRRRNNDWKSFRLDPDTGILTLNTKLDMVKQSLYLVIVIE